MKAKKEETVVVSLDELRDHFVTEFLAKITALQTLDPFINQARLMPNSEEPITIRFGKGKEVKTKLTTKNFKDLAKWGKEYVSDVQS